MRSRKADIKRKKRTLSSQRRASVASIALCESSAQRADWMHLPASVISSPERQLLPPSRLANRIPWKYPLRRVLFDSASTRCVVVPLVSHSAWQRTRAVRRSTLARRVRASPILPWRAITPTRATGVTLTAMMYLTRMTNDCEQDRLASDRACAGRWLICLYVRTADAAIASNSFAVASK